VDSGTAAELVLAVATLGLVVATLLLVWESRRQRVEANVVAWVAPWELAGGLYLAIQVENTGPAIARSLVLDWRFVSATLPNGHLAEPVMSVGFRRTMLPTREQRLDALAAQGVPIEIDLSWRDGRRGTQTQKVRTDCRAVKAAVDESRAMPRPSQAEVLGQIRDELEKIARSK
jgi:hypothetical protein